MLGQVQAHARIFIIRHTACKGRVICRLPKTQITKGALANRANQVDPSAKTHQEMAFTKMTLPACLLLPDISYILIKT